MPKHIVCFSGGMASALAAIEVSRKFGAADLVLVNHDINPLVEDPDIKRFKIEVAAYIGCPITFANYRGAADPTDIPDQFDISLLARGFKFQTGVFMCACRLKTEPFTDWLLAYPHRIGAQVYFGFEPGEEDTMQRRREALTPLGFDVRFPLVEWPQTLYTTRTIGIEPPITYDHWKRANCVGCLRAGRQHWYCVYCLRRDVFDKAVRTERTLGHSILAETYLDRLAPTFERMRLAGVKPSEHIPPGQFWSNAKKRMEQPVLAF